MPQVKIIIVKIVIYSGAPGGNKIWLSMRLRILVLTKSPVTTYVYPLM